MQLQSRETVDYPAKQRVAVLEAIRSTFVLGDFRQPLRFRQVHVRDHESVYRNALSTLAPVDRVLG